MKIIFFVVSIILTVLCCNVRGKYIKTTNYAFDQTNPTSCTGEPIMGVYQLSGFCMDSYVKTVCNRNGTVDQILYERAGCQGLVLDVTTMQVETCQQLTLLECVDNIDNVPSNSFVEVITKNSCENDPNWKHNINMLTYTLLDSCISGSDNSIIITCNSTSPLPVFNIYNSTYSCPGEPTGYELRRFPICSRDDPTFVYCNI